MLDVAPGERGDIGENRTYGAAPQAGGGIAHRHVYALAGMPIDAVSLDDALDIIEQSIRHKRRLFISTPNSNFIAAATRDPEFLRSVRQSDLVVPDGMPLVLFAKLLGLPCKGRVTGADIFEQLIGGARPNTPFKVFFFGGPPGVAQAAHSRLNTLKGPVTSVGGMSPPYASVESMSDEETIAQINAADPDFILVALGAVKGQKWIVNNQSRLNASVLVHLGAVVNFTAGNVKRAPRWVQKVGAEWLWRIYQEPTLWRRYGADGLLLIRIFMSQIVPFKLLGEIRDGLGAHIETADKALLCAEEGHSRLILRGRWESSDSHHLGEMLDASILQGRPVILDAQHLESICSECVALLLLAKSRTPSLYLKHASGPLMQELGWWGATDLVEPFN